MCPQPISCVFPQTFSLSVFILLVSPFIQLLMQKDLVTSSNYIFFCNPDPIHQQVLLELILKYILNLTVTRVQTPPSPMWTTAINCCIVSLWCLVSYSDQSFTQVIFLECKRSHVTTLIKPWLTSQPTENKIQNHSMATSFHIILHFIFKMWKIIVFIAKSAVRIGWDRSDKELIAWQVLHNY